LPELSIAYIQSYQTDHILFRSLQEPERLYRSDLRARQAVHMPPYTKLVRLSTGKPTLFAAETEGTRVYQMIERILTEHHISGIVSNPFTPSPTFYRGQHWISILIKLSPESWQTDIKTLLAHIPSQWKIDISPQSLLAP
jgi:primosomal protein N'